jgi:formylglycine-generating enzyme required for sulfatase activity
LTSLLPDAYSAHPLRPHRAGNPGIVAIVVLTVGASGAGARTPAAAGPVWVRLEVVENTADGPSADRCEIQATVDGGRARHWRVFYGEVRPGPDAGWTAIRARSGCAPVASDEDPGPWTLGGSPYLLVDVGLAGGTGAAGDVRLEASLTTRRLTGFSGNGTPAYARTTETRTLRVPEGGSAVVPVLVASAREADAFRVRELLLRFRAADLASRPRAEYGEIAVASDVAPARVLLDGGLVGRTSPDGPLVVPNVRTGARTVAIRDPSGRQARAVVQVDAGRRSDVSLTLLPAARRSDPPGLRALGGNPQGSEEFWRARDGAIVVRIPGGEFHMGTAEGEGEPPEHPRHVVRLRGFLIDKTEVTWGRYRRFAARTGRPLPKSPVWGMPEAFPVSTVTWDDARAYCAWAGGRLPTEAEWERAARGDDARRYPWGDEWDPARCTTRDGGPHGPSAVATYPDCVSPWGVLDLAGGLWEWCADWFDEAYYARSPAEDPKGPDSGKQRVARGGSWISPAFSARSAYREGMEPALADILHGFRCAQDDPGVTRTATAATDISPSRPVVVVETSVGPSARCEVVHGTGTGPFRSWSTFGEGRAEPGGGFALAAAPAHCGAGAFPVAPGSARAVPFLILEVSVTPTRDPGAMDPGPARVVQIGFTVTTRRLLGFAPAGGPLWGDAVPDHRTARLTGAEELVVPVLPADARERAALGGEILVRIRATQDAEAAYGDILVMGAAAHSEVLLDGGAVAPAGTDGTTLVAGVPAGTREVTMRDGSGRRVSRIVTVVAGRTVVVSAGDAAEDPGARGALTRLRGAREIRRPRDGATMVRIPAGEFLMGNLEAEVPTLPHRVRVGSFLFDTLPVTWGRFKQFAAATGRPLPPAPYWGIHDDHPVVFVSWDEARAYCEWAGARLPTEAEREKAARGTDDRTFPWGNEEPSPERAVFRRNWGAEGTDPVGIRPAGASPYGVLDAAGNVWEWCEDWYDPDYYRSGPDQDPTGPRTGRARVVRGGSWDSRPTVLATSYRNFGYVGYREGDYGFRCAADPAR